MEADSETDNSHTEKRNSATGGDTGTAVEVWQSPRWFILYRPHECRVTLYCLAVYSHNSIVIVLVCVLLSPLQMELVVREREWQWCCLQFLVWFS